MFTRRPVAYGVTFATLLRLPSSPVESLHSVITHKCLQRMRDLMPVLNHFDFAPIIVGPKAGLKSNAFYEWTDISNIRESQRKRKTDDLNDGSNEKRSRVEGRAKGQSPAVSSLWVDK
ncbi:unnamed protein product, partial [Medioppia subpectinata]